MNNSVTNTKMSKPQHLNGAFKGDGQSMTLLSLFKKLVLTQTKTNMVLKYLKLFKFKFTILLLLLLLFNSIKRVKRALFFIYNNYFIFWKWVPVPTQTMYTYRYYFFI